MSQERTEEQILTRAPIEVVLGGKKYQLPVLSIGQSIEWRKKLITATSEISRPLLRPLHVPLWRRFLDFLCFWRPHNRAKDYIIAGLGTAFVAFPERVLDLILEYDQTHILPHGEILDNASEEELFTAFSEVMAVANPLRRQISLMSQVMGAMPSQSRPESSTSSSSPSTDSRRVM